MVDDNTQGNRSSEVSSCKQVQTVSIVYNTDRRMRSDDLNNLDKGILSVGSKGSVKVTSNDKSYLVC